MYYFGNDGVLSNTQSKPSDGWKLMTDGWYYFRNGSMIKSEFLTQGNITWYLDENGKFQLNKSGLIAYSHGEYLDLGKEIGTFGYSVKKKTKKPQKRKKKKVER